MSKVFEVGDTVKPLPGKLFHVSQNDTVRSDLLRTDPKSLKCDRVVTRVDGRLLFFGDGMFLYQEEAELVIKQWNKES